MLQCALESSPVWETFWRRSRLVPALVASQPRIDRFALQSEDPEDALLDSAQRLPSDKALQSLDSQDQFTDGKGPLPREPAFPQALQILRCRVLGPLDDSTIFPTQAFEGRL